jgi:hypothetical protein
MRFGEMPMALLVGFATIHILPGFVPSASQPVSRVRILSSSLPSPVSAFSRERNFGQV